VGAKAGIAKGQALSPWPAPAKRELGHTPLLARGGTDQTDQFWPLLVIVREAEPYHDIAATSAAVLAGAPA